MSRNIELVIFDLDGVLVDTAKYHYLAWNKLGKTLGINFTEEQNEAFKGVSRMACMEIMCELAGKQDLPEEEKVRLATIKNENYLELIESINNEELLEGVEGFLKELKKQGIKIALGSASKNALPILEKTGIRPYFDAIIDGNKVTKAKPDPEVFVLAAKTLNIPAENCVVFEDAYAGVEAAKCAGMACVGIGTKENLPQADYVFKNVGEVTIQLLKTL